MSDIYCRKEEIAELERLSQSKKAEFLAVYGRRRVGKTYLITRFFENQFAFFHTGLPPYKEGDGHDSSGDGRKDHRKMRDQLNHFAESLAEFGYASEGPLDSWLDAFSALKSLLKPLLNKGKKVVVFLDELPWMDTPKSGFLQEFQAFCNSFACRYDDILLIVAGSNITWISSELINGYGGLYDRLTAEMKLSPLSLGECEDYLLRGKGIRFSRYDLAFAYMVFGGVPYYLDKFKTGLSLPQIIDSCFFGKNATLRNEFHRLFLSSFRNGEKIQQIVTALSERSLGLTREEIASSLGLASGGNISEYLSSLENADFIVSYTPLGEAKNAVYYRLIDPFCLFYLRFVLGSTKFDEKLFSGLSAGGAINSWRGFAFENVCFNHIASIKKALGVSGVFSKQYAFIDTKDKKKQAQIDMVIDRADNIVNLCEMKFTKSSYEHDKTEHDRLLNRENRLEALIPKRKVIRKVLITTIGLKNGIHSSDFDKVLVLDDLFDE